MALQLRNHIALLLNIFRYPKNPTVKYLRQNLPKKLKGLQKHLKHYYRFKKAPDIVKFKMNELCDYDIGEYGSYIKVIGDLFDVKAIWAKELSGDLDTLETVILVGNIDDVRLASRFIHMMVYLTEEVTLKEGKKFKDIKKQIRKKLRSESAYQEWADTNLTGRYKWDSRVYTSNFKLQIIYNLNLHLLRLLEIKESRPNDTLIYKYIMRNFKLRFDNKRGNPNWDPLKIVEGTAAQAISRDLLFQKDKILN